MARSGKAKRWLERIIMASPHLIRAAGLLNRLAISSLGVQVVSAWRAAIDKEWFDRLLYFQRLFDLLKGIQGDVVECGVASGHTLAILASLVRSSGITRQIWGFDSWSGLPTPSREDLASAESVANRALFTHSSVEAVLATLRWYGFDDPEISNTVTLIKGSFSETLPNYGGPPIALLHIDADLYNSYQDALRHLWPKVSVGGIAAFDEYDLPDYWPGARQAVDEFLSQCQPGSVRLERDALYGKYYAVRTA